MSLYFYFPPPPPPATSKSLSPHSSLPKASPHLFSPNPNPCSQCSQSYLFSRCKSDQITSLPKTLQWFCIAHGVGFRILSGLQAPQVRTPAASYCFFSSIVFPCLTFPASLHSSLLSFTDSFLRPKSHSFKEDFLASSYKEYSSP